MKKEFKTSTDLFEHYGSVIIPMCKGTSIEDTPWECVKCGVHIIDSHPSFVNKIEEYKFALTVLEDTPVFVGDMVYSKRDGTRFIVALNSGFNWRMITLTQPKSKRTFMLNGIKLPCPTKEPGVRLDFLGIDYEFESIDDRNDVAAAIKNMLDNAREL